MDDDALDAQRERLAAALAGLAAWWWRRGRFLAGYADDPAIPADPKVVAAVKRAKTQS